MEPDFMGKMVDVVILSASKFSLMSRPIVKSTPQRPDVPEALPKGQVSGLIDRPQSTASGAVTWWPVATMAVLAGLRLAWIIYRRR